MAIGIASVSGGETRFELIILRQITNVDAPHLPAPPQPVQGKNRVRAADDDQVQLGWLVIQQKSYRFMNFQFADDVIIIKHEDNSAGHVGQVVNEKS